MGLLTVTELQFVQWDKSNLWDINLDGKSGVKCPAIQVELGFLGGESTTLGDTALSYPKTTVYPTLTITYLDNEWLDFTTYLRDWYKKISKTDNFNITPISDCVKPCIISKLNSMKIPLDTWVLQIYPTGQVTYQGDSDGGMTPTYTVEFVVAGGEI